MWSLPAIAAVLILITATHASPTYSSAEDEETGNFRPTCKKIFNDEDRNLPETVTFCEQTHSYVGNLFTKKLRGVPLSAFFYEDVKTRMLNQNEGLTHSDADTDHYLCQVNKAIVTPKAALSIDHKWYYIINHGEFLQQVEVEVCENANRRCQLPLNGVLGYNSKCKQKYRRERMLAIDAYGNPFVDYFFFPFGCSCVLKRQKKFTEVFDF